MRRALVSLIASLFTVTPLMAKDEPALPNALVEPTVDAELINTVEVARGLRDELGELSPFRSRPAIRIGLMVEADGKVTECLAVPTEGSSLAYGQELCPSLSKIAKFMPAKDSDGNSIRSIFFAKLDGYRPGSAAENQTL